MMRSRWIDGDVPPNGRSDGLVGDFSRLGVLGREEGVWARR
jgi:hypothetical protein